MVTAALDLRGERLTKTACAADGTRLTCSVCLDCMRAGQSVGALPAVPSNCLRRAHYTLTRMTVYARWFGSRVHTHFIPLA